MQISCTSFILARRGRIPQKPNAQVSQTAPVDIKSLLRPELIIPNVDFQRKVPLHPIDCLESDFQRQTFAAKDIQEKGWSLI